MAYVDGFLLPVPRKNVQAYRRIATKTGKVWREHGAPEYRECVGEDLRAGMAAPFARAVKLKPGETGFFSWIVYRSRAHRDRVNARGMKDPRLLKLMQDSTMPFDMRRMYYGGFKILVDLLPGSGVHRNGMGV